MLAAEIARNPEDTNMALLERCRREDPDAYGEFFSLYNRKIYNTAYRILGEEASAEDALQETMLNVYRGLANFRGDAKISTWISRITVNVCLGMLRKTKNLKFVDLDSDPVRELPAAATASVDPLQHASREETRGLVEEAFARMSRKQEVVVRLHDLDGYTIQDVARILRCPAGTVKSRLFYGRQEFKNIYRSLLGRRVAHPTIQ